MDELPDEMLAEVELLLRQRIGLNPDAVSNLHIHDAINQRLTACVGVGVAGYVERLRSQEDEFQELVERLIVPESWFFRDVQPFRCIEHYLWGKHSCLPQAKANKNVCPTGLKQLRVLSAPCGTGEEPYSIAMTLLNAGLAAAQIKVDAVDISRHALQRAAEGAYDELSFREREETVPGFRERFFHRADQRLVVIDKVRAAVHFRQGNIVTPDFLEGEERYHVIFCRNLLIYLDADARRVTLANFHRLLRADGLLYVGHVEGASVTAGLFRKYGSDFPFAFQPVQAGEAERKIEGAAPQSKPHMGTVARQTQMSTATPDAAKTMAQAPAEGEPHVRFDMARQAADRGRLDEAETQCLELLARYPPGAEVYCLLGVVRQAQGKAAEAAKCFHKALYLDPRHHEALVHAALLARQRGDEKLGLKYDLRAARARAELSR